MSIFKQQYKARNGETRASAKWYYGFRDHKDIERRLPGFTDRRLTERLGENINDLVSLRKIGKPPTNALADWLEQLAPNVIDYRVTELAPCSWGM